jgi:parallel beta-helix repeat protein
VVKNSTAYDNDGLAHTWSGNGIRMELSTQPILIEGNTVYGNAGAQIGIESCKFVTVTGNTITGTNVALKDWPRGSTYALSNISITDNVFIRSGVLAEGGTWTPTSAAEKSLTIDRNTYEGGLKYNWNYRTYFTTLSDVRNKLGLEWNGTAA